MKVKDKTSFATMVLLIISALAFSFGRSRVDIEDDLLRVRGDGESSKEDKGQDRRGYVHFIGSQVLVTQVTKVEGEEVRNGFRIVRTTTVLIKGLAPASGICSNYTKLGRVGHNVVVGSHEGVCGVMKTSEVCSSVAQVLIVTLTHISKAEV